MATNVIVKEAFVSRKLSLVVKVGMGEYFGKDFFLVGHAANRIGKVLPRVGIIICQNWAESSDDRK